MCLPLMYMIEHLFEQSIDLMNEVQILGKLS